MLEHSMWLPYLAAGLGSGLIGLALLAYRAIAPDPVRTFPSAAVGFVGAGVANGLLAALAFSGDDVDVLVTVVLTGVLTVVIGLVATVFSPSSESNDA